MQRAAQGPRANNLLVGERLLDLFFDRAAHPQSDPPQCPGIILGLDGAKPTHHLLGLFEWSMGDMLVVETYARNVHVFHWQFIRPQYKGRQIDGQALFPKRKVIA